jgi:hypothetical protein
MRAHVPSYAHNQRRHMGHARTCNIVWTHPKCLPEGMRYEATKARDSCTDMKMRRIGYGQNYIVLTYVCVSDKRVRTACRCLHFRGTRNYSAWASKQTFIQYAFRKRKNTDSSKIGRMQHTHQQNTLERTETCTLPYSFHIYVPEAIFESVRNCSCCHILFVNQHC